MIKRIRFGDDLEPSPDAVRAVAGTAIEGTQASVLLEWFDVDPELSDDAVLVEEHVVRGAEWLVGRPVGSESFVHMALSRRAPGLSRAEFGERWRAHAGTARRSGDGTATPLPDNVLGDAYVQNHPVARDPDPDFDAVNEVWFDDLEGLRRRIAHFEERGIGRVGDDLFGPAQFLALRAIH